MIPNFHKLNERKLYSVSAHTLWTEKEEEIKNENENKKIGLKTRKKFTTKKSISFKIITIKLKCIILTLKV